MKRRDAIRAGEREIPVAPSALWQLHRKVSRGVLLGVALSALACAELLGPIEIERVPDQDDAPLQGRSCEAGASASCAPGTCPAEAYRCDAQVLQQCNTAGDAWVDVEHCGSASLCDAAAQACRLPACADGEHRCTDAGELIACNAERTGFDLIETCGSAAFCSPARGRQGCAPIACRAGRQRCNGAQIEECRQDRRGFDAVGEPCASPALCVAGQSEQASCLEPACAAGEFRCNGELLERCADELDGFIFVRDCETLALCDAVGGRCGEPACTPGQRRCQGAVLEVCDAERSGYVPERECATAAACDAQAPGCLDAPPPVEPPPVEPPPVLDGAAYTFVSASGAAALGLGPLRLELPAQWTEVDTTPWTNAGGQVLGPRLVASTDAARFATGFDIPGVYFAATAEGPISVTATHARFDLSARCTRGESDSYYDGVYSGTSQTWLNCGATRATNVVVAALPEDERFVAVVIVTLTGERDQVALRRIWDSFLVD